MRSPETLLFSVIFAAILAMSGVASGSSLSPGTAQGVVELEGETIVIKHAYAYERSMDGEDGLYVLLTDMAVEPDALGGDEQAYSKLFVEKNVRGVEARINPDQPEYFRGMFLAGKKEDVRFGLFKLSYTSNNLPWKAIKIESDGVSGAISMPKDDKGRKVVINFNAKRHALSASDP